MPSKPGLRVASPAKINTFLHVYPQRADGFHDLLTHFQLLTLCDYLNFRIDRSDRIVVNNPSLNIAMENDLCYRAAAALKTYSKQPLGVIIDVDKQIPEGGGLGGGSSNAATVLVVLNRLWELHLSEETLLAIGLTLGSDVPVFIHGESICAEGRGERFVTNIVDNLPLNQAIIVVKPPVSVSTKEIFHSRLLTKRDNTGKIRDLDTARYGNDFEPVVYQLYPDISYAAKQLSVYSLPHLTGTGACLYTVLDDVEKADKIIDALGDEYRVFLTYAIDKSPLNEFK